MKTKKKLQAYQIALILVGLLAIGGVVGAATGFSMRNVERLVASDISTKIEIPATSDEEITLGAIPGDTLNSPTWTVNGVKQRFASQKFTTVATSSLCSVKAPDNATSTIEKVRVNITTGTTTASNLGIVVATSTRAFATTTDVYLVSDDKWNLATLTGYEYAWTNPTASGGNYSAAWIKPGEFLLVRTNGPGSYSGYSLGGNCYIEFGGY